MSFPKNVWSQLKNITAKDLINALERDNWEHDVTRGAIQAFIKLGNSPSQRVTIHYHPKKTYGAKLLGGLLKDIGWSEDDLRRLKLIK